MDKTLGKIITFVLMLILLYVCLNLGTIYSKMNERDTGENQTTVSTSEIGKQGDSVVKVGDNKNEYEIESFYVNGKSVAMSIVTKNINDKNAMLEVAQQIKNKYSQEYNSKGYHSITIDVYENQSTKYGTMKNGLGKIYIAYTEEGKKYLNMDTEMKIYWTKNEEIVVE